VAGDALAFYLQKLVLPIHLGIDYGRRPEWQIHEAALYWRWLIPVVVLTGLVGFKDRRVWLTAAFVFVAALSPVLGLVPFAYQDVSTVADRYVHLALFGPALACAWILKNHWRPNFIGVASAVCVALAVGSFLQTSTWRNDEALYQQALRINPRSFVTIYNLAVPKLEAGDVQNALPMLEQSRRLMPRNPKVNLMIGNALMELGRSSEAIAHWRRAVHTTPNVAEIHNNLGRALLEGGDLDGAIQHFRGALKLAPTVALVRCNLAGALEQRGQLAEAEAECLRCLQKEPAMADALALLGKIRVRQGRLDDGLRHLHRALDRSPDSAAVHFCLGIAYSRAGNARGAEARFREALRIRPGLLPPREHLAWLLATHADKTFRTGSEALELARAACMATDFADPRALDVMAAALAETGSYHDAARNAGLAIDIARRQGKEDWARQFEKRRELYRAGQPFREATSSLPD